MAAEWRPDPMGRAQWRWHDGATWTRHIAVDGRQSIESEDLPMALAKTPPAPPVLAGQDAPAPDPSTLVAQAFVPTYPGSPGYAPDPRYPAWATQPRRKGGRLIAAGILGIISGVLGFFGAIGYFALLSMPNCADAAPGADCTNVVLDQSGIIKVLMGASIVFTIGLFVVGIGGCMRRYWGQRGLVFLGIVQVVFDVVAIIVRSNPIGFVNIVFCAVLIGLAMANDRREYEIPKGL